MWKRIENETRFFQDMAVGTMRLGTCIVIQDNFRRVRFVGCVPTAKYTVEYIKIGLDAAHQNIDISFHGKSPAPEWNNLPYACLGQNGRKIFQKLFCAPSLRRSLPGDFRVPLWRHGVGPRTPTPRPNAFAFRGFAVVFLHILNLPSRDLSEHDGSADHNAGAFLSLRAFAIASQSFG